jgi:hypothetical protein
MRIAGRSLLFAIAASIVSIMVDFALWGGYQGFQPREQSDAALLSHALMHGGAFLLAGIAAVVCFTVLRHRLPSPTATSVLGGVFGAVAPFASVAAMASFGLVAGAVALFTIALLVAGLGGFIFGRHRG